MSSMGQMCTIVVIFVLMNKCYIRTEASQQQEARVDNGLLRVREGANSIYPENRYIFQFKGTVEEQSLVRETFNMPKKVHYLIQSINIYGVPRQS